MKAKLYIVATPIGNLTDISFRAIDVLKEVDVIAAEDTRHSQMLLNHYNIQTPMFSYHLHNEAAKNSKIIERLAQGKSVALISDAGTPLISDPGESLVRAVSEAGFEISPVPGACALVSALSVCGLSTDKFLFVGFLPAKKSQRESALRHFEYQTVSLVFYEAPHRILEMLASCRDVLGEQREYCIAKELTKTFEMIRRGSIADILSWLDEDVTRQKGEFVVIVGPGIAQDRMSEAQVLLSKLIECMPLKPACKIVSETFSVNKNELYKLALETKG